MSQCVPSWDNNHFTDTYNDNDHLHHPPYPPSATTKQILTRNLDSNFDVPKLDYEVAELTWENGQLALHGLGQPRVPTWELPPTSTSAASGTLESIVNRANCFLTPSFKPIPCNSPPGEELVPCFNQQSTPAPAASTTMKMDALVPLCSNTNNNKTNCAGNIIITSCEDSNGVPGGVGGFTHVDQSCSSGMNSSQAEKSVSPAVLVAGEEWSTMSSSHEYSGYSSRKQATLDTCRERDNGSTAFTSSTTPADNTSSGMLCTKPTGEDHDSIFHSRSIAKADDGGSTGATKKKGSSSVKRSRAAAIHTQSERKRRDRINQRMKTLQKLVPNSNKTDKASMLDEVIEYLKQLQAQVTIVNRMNMNMPQMTMMPMNLNQQALQMSMMTPMGAAAAMAMGMGGMLDMNNAAAAMAAGRANMPVSHLMYPSGFMPMQPASWDPSQLAMIMPDPMMSTFFASQSHQPMTMDSYRMMASLYQHMQQTQQQLTPNSKS